jgi:hypothetical protein
MFNFATPAVDSGILARDIEQRLRVVPCTLGGSSLLNIKEGEVLAGTVLRLDAPYKPVWLLDSQNAQGLNSSIKKEAFFKILSTLGQSHIDWKMSLSISKQNDDIETA